MQRRNHISKRKSKKIYAKTQDLTHKFNIEKKPILRGGIRL